MRYFFKYIILLITLVFSAYSWAGVKVGVVLPLHDKDGDGLRMVEYYRGVLMAVDQLKNEGYDIVVSTWNVPQDGSVSVVTSDKNAAKCDIIFGPLYSSQVKELGDFCKSKKIKLVIPFSINSWEVTRNEYIFQVYQTPYNQTLLNVKADSLELSASAAMVLAWFAAAALVKRISVFVFSAYIFQISISFNLRCSSSLL